MKLSDLLRKRAALAAHSSDLAQQAASVSRELELVDQQLFARMRTLVEAIEGGEPEEAGGAPQPPPLRRRPLTLEQPDPAPNMPDLPPDLFQSGMMRPRANRGSKLGPQIVAALTEIGRPVSRVELFDWLEKNGITVPGKDPKANLSAHLSYMEEVTRTDNGLWALKDWPNRQESSERQTPA